ncbi:hypothetical protein Ae168Ps1_5998 [Pseudonocardia sp. Ae168_Ps1]|uniref:DUF1707 SHOCT-like domain-containing protein n=1 Tax=unclassified Pseudonocardia TaxID=2619320 RepID=UPI00094ACA6E|nr:MULTISPECIES: DUF1707 domain-containing protein [unclassified Pseudonocardia]OLL71495.1 hypothetical protein Ae168Ps1_5998 [Pseudonocardia sp. Ae168_Ps1]OLL76957.1 hypothetical protein Ae150APs1_5335c [Pseudonocardia sp. Ae150A_Ps1]OLL88931.1 hypothetical protein Ae263Ps1_5986 [Pseudonocardia sp. Ae263_Ps1]OLL91044.1 hypothetical protein Ae356Ps1_0941c [Pseudonocardia sp. Ae356_Ps1]
MTSSEGPIAPRDLRVSHDEREHVTALLARHHTEGRLTADEFAERSARASAAVTRADLNGTVADLPGALDAVPTREVLELTNTAGDLRRGGEWLVPPRIVVRSWFGNARLDMRRARFITGEVVIECDLTFGNLELRLPPEATVDVEDVSTSVGSVLDRRGAAAERGVPHVIVRGGTLIGNIRVR